MLLMLRKGSLEFFEEVFGQLRVSANLPEPPDDLALRGDVPLPGRNVAADHLDLLGPIHAAAYACGRGCS